MTAFLVNLLHMVIAGALALIGVDYDAEKPCEEERPQAVSFVADGIVLEFALWQADEVIVINSVAATGCQAQRTPVLRLPDAARPTTL
ncbi:MAG: hypothetical protein AAFX09_09315 [Pseudomonadota bacterium]